MNTIDCNTIACQSCEKDTPSNLRVCIFCNAVLENKKIEEEIRYFPVGSNSIYTKMGIIANSPDKKNDWAEVIVLIDNLLTNQEPEFILHVLDNESNKIGNYKTRSIKKSDSSFEAKFKIAAANNSSSRVKFVAIQPKYGLKADTYHIWGNQKTSILPSYFLAFIIFISTGLLYFFSNIENSGEIKIPETSKVKVLDNNKKVLDNNKEKLPEASKIKVSETKEKLPEASKSRLPVESSERIDYGIEMLFKLKNKEINILSFMKNVETFKKTNKPFFDDLLKIASKVDNQSEIDNFITKWKKE